MQNLSLRIDDLTFKYGSRRILHEINLQIKKGSFVSIIGPNGSGKTTLLKNIAAVLLPEKGKVLLDSESIYSLSPKKLARRLALVPQDTTCDFSFTVFETVLMGRMPYLQRFKNESPTDIAIARWAMEITNTWHLRERLITEISGGERQRVIIARALAQEPKVILLDEPVAHLDIQHQLEVLELLNSLRRSQKLTVLTVLHDLNHAAHFSDYMVLMNEGKIFSAGKPNEVLTTENIEQVYKMEVAIIPNQFTGSLNIIPVARKRPVKRPIRKSRVHLVCGGGAGSFIMEKLVQSGYQVSCGVLNIGDSDWNKARELGIKISEEAPFSPISKNAAQKNKELISDAEIIILMSLPFGTGNLTNLQQVYEALKDGKKVIVVGSKSLEGKDFTGGKAQKLYDSIVRWGAVVVPLAKNLFEVLEEIS